MATRSANTTSLGANPAQESANGDIRGDLQKVLSDSNFSFNGSFCHGSLLSNPQNPCLTIEGLGLVGLPLGERDAKAIIATCPALAPPRRGKKGGRAKKEVRNTWEIQPSKVSFGNAAWQNYVDTTLCLIVCQSLGVRVGASLPKMELSKLLVYETGAQYLSVNGGLTTFPIHRLLPHQETQKADGVFGTAIILLPSTYTGGQVIISHASTTKTIDFAKESMLSTVLLAWYTNVVYELKPIESGYRVALVYNLVSVAQEIGIPLPCLPDMTNSIRELQRVLEKWKNGKDKTNSPPFIAYLLKERHDPFIFKIQGTGVLKGVDLHRATSIRPVAEKMGFRLYVASLEHKITGFSEDNYNKPRNRRGRYRSWLDELEAELESEDDGTTYMTEIHSTTTKITELRDMNGASILFGSSIDVGSNCLVPNKPFEGEVPDETENEGYACSQLVYRYHRTALILIPEDKADDILYEALGSFYAYRMLSKSMNIPPTSDDRKWAERLLKCGKSLKESDILLLMKFALSWKDIHLWKSTASSPSCTVAMVNSKTLANPMEVFAFEEMRPSFEALLEGSKSLTDKMNFLYTFSTKRSSHENDTMNVWYQKEVMKILSSCSSAKVEDVPTLLSIICLVGLQSFQNLVMPNLIKDKSYGFWMAFVKALLENRKAILEQESTRVPSTVTNVAQETNSLSPAQTAENALRGIIRKGLEFASTEWNSVGFKPDYYRYSYANETPPLIRNVKLERIIEVIEQAILASDLEMCKTVFDDILTSKWFTAFQKINDIFCPLLPLLRDLLAKKNLDIFQSPFVDFIRSFVGLYLREVLGKRTELSSAHMRKVGCLAAASGACGECKQLDDFIMNPRQKATLIRAPKARRVHLERRADDGQDQFTYTIVTSTSPHSLQLTKCPAAIEASMWSSRQKAAKIFLDSIGSLNDLARIMGNRCLDLKHAFEGSRPYDTPLASITTPTATTMIQNGAATTQRSMQSQASRVANVPQPQPSALHSTAAVPRKASATGFPQEVTSKKRKT